MGIVELLVIAVGVSMDAFAVSICKGLSVKSIRPKHVLSTALWFGGFQALMPLIGYYIGYSFVDLVSEIDHWITFGLLLFIGGNMIMESFENDECGFDANFSFRNMLILAIATSIDAMAVGVSLSFMKISIFVPILIIGVTTAVFSGAGIIIGRYLGCRFKRGAELLGGVVLALIGIKILLEHIGLI